MTKTKLSITKKAIRYNTSQAGEVKQAVLPNGKTVRRVDKIEYLGAMIPCAPYDNHFIYHLPDSVENRGPSDMCTCGSNAVIAGYSVVEKDTSIVMGEMIPTDEPVYRAGEAYVRGGMFVCKMFAETGRHQNSG